MPTDLVKQLAQKRGLQVSAVEATWNDAKEAAAKSGHDEDWPYVMNIFLSMIGKNEMTTSAMAAPYGIPLGQIVRELPPPAKRKREEEAVRAGVRYAYELGPAGAQIAAHGLASDRSVRESRKMVDIDSMIEHALIEADGPKNPSDERAVKEALAGLKGHVDTLKTVILGLQKASDSLPSSMRPAALKLAKIAKSLVADRLSLQGVHSDILLNQ